MRHLKRPHLLALGAVVGVATGAGVVACAGPDRDEPVTALQAPRAATTWHGFSVDRWPPASWRPYSSRSPFNQRVTPGTQPHPSSNALVDQLLSWGPPGHLTAGVAQTRDDWGHPTYYARSDDPLFTLRTTAPYGRNPIDGMRIPVPDRAAPAGGGDGHMTVVTPDGWEYDLWQVHDKPRGGGTLSFSWGGRLRVDGDGLRTGGTASRFGNLAGMIRAQELQAGRINHALFVVLRCAGTGGFGYGERRRQRGESSYVYPAVSGGAPCPEGVLAPPMGARLRLALTGRQIDRLALPAWKKTILRALARYGGYVGDTGGDGIGLMFESSAMYTSLGRPDPLVAFAQSQGLPSFGGRYAFDIGEGFDWRRWLRVVPPPSR